MAENIQRSSGRSNEYKLDRGGAAAESGPFIGIVTNNVDPTRSGRLQVFITELAAGADQKDSATWRTVSYLSPYYGVTQHTGSNADEGAYVGNRHSYGMWFTPPDLGTRVLCFFASGDPNQGYYVGCIPEPGLTHMVPAVGAVSQAKRDNATQQRLFGGATRLPVTEINDLNEGIADNPRFYDKTKPVHSYAAGILFQQGLINDRIRGPIGSSSQRESPSAVYGISTPGRAIYEAGLSERDIKQRLEKGELKPHDVKVIGRRGGHSFVMDDGDLEGADALVRIRTARGHQLIMSDDGECFHFIHANGQSWIELGKEGAIDVYSTNSINLRTQGDMNFHADKNINMFAGEQVNIRANKAMQFESATALTMISDTNITLHAAADIGVLANGTLAVKADGAAAISAGGAMSVTGSRVNLNSGGAASVAAPAKIKQRKLADVEWNADNGWVAQAGKLTSIVSRAPTHEPYDQHSKGVDVTVELAPTAPPPPAPAPATTEKLAQASQQISADGITAGDFAAAQKATAPIGPISADQVTGMIAQKAKTVAQDVAEMSIEKGIGKLGITAQQLEDAGFLKPGIAGIIASTPAMFQSVLETAEAWTAKDGITNVGQILSSEKLQVSIQEAVLNTAYQALEKSGVLRGIEQAAEVAGLVQAAVEHGPALVVDWANGEITEIESQINSIVSEAKNAVEFVTQKLPESLSVAIDEVAATATSIRVGVDGAVNDIIGNAKVPAVVYQVGDLANEVISNASAIANAAGRIADRASTAIAADVQSKLNTLRGRLG